MPDEALPAPDAVAAIQRRAVWVLSLAQVLGGLAFGATISLGPVLAASLAGDSFSGLAIAAVTLGSAAMAVPLAALARRRGRRLALSTGLLVALGGVALVVLAAATRSFPLLLVSFALIGSGQAVNLQTRFAAADLATAATRGRDLSVVVWATTIGAVLGPNLVEPGEALGSTLGMPALTGPYLFSIVALLCGVLLLVTLLRPDPLLLAQRLAAAPAAVGAPIAGEDRAAVARYAIVAIAGAHGVMVAVMAMTSVHLVGHGATLTIVGLTISLHIAGMYALSPIFGILADRLGRLPTILLGQAMLVVALIIAAVGESSTAAVGVGLTILGLGWSATTVSGSALLTEASSEQLRTRRQGRSDLIMNLVGAIGATLAGAVLAWIGYAGLALASLVIVAVVVALAPLGRTRPSATSTADAPASR